MLNQLAEELEGDRCETFADFVLDALLQLAPALDFTKRLLDAQGLDVQVPHLRYSMSGFDLLAFDLSSIAISLAYADGNIAREECELLSGLGYLMRSYTARPFVELNFAAFKEVKGHDNWYVPLVCLDLIAAYDHIFEAAQGGLLRSLYYKFAIEMVDADKRQTPEENARLAEFWSLLYPFADEEILVPQRGSYTANINSYAMPLRQDENLKIGEPA